MDEERASRLPEATAALQKLQRAAADCHDCVLSEKRTQVVFGVGSPVAKLMFVGEAPGFHEDRQGEPFVGQAGKLLTTLLGQIGLTREDVYIANVIKCRPPENRDPLQGEIEACSPRLMEQISVIRPDVICTLGRFAAKLLTGTELSMTQIHGKAKPMQMGGVDLVVFPVFHPAAALYTPANRSVLEEDFRKLEVLLNKGLNGSAAGATGGLAEMAVDSATQDAALVSHGGESISSPQPATEDCAAPQEPTADKAPAPDGEQLHLW